MDWMGFVSNLIGHLAWPIAVIWVVLLFRKQIRERLATMKSFKGPGGVEAVFSEEAAQLAGKSVGFGIPTAIQGPAPTGKPSKQVIPIDKKDRPSAVVVGVWQKIESMLVDLLDLKGIHTLPSDKRLWNVSASIEALMIAKVIDGKTADALHSLYKLRNWVAHNDFEPDDKATNEFFVAAERVISVLESTTEKFITQ